MKIKAIRLDFFFERGSLLVRYQMTRTVGAILFQEEFLK